MIGLGRFLVDRGSVRSVALAEVCFVEKDRRIVSENCKYMF